MVPFDFRVVPFGSAELEPRLRVSVFSRRESTGDVHAASKVKTDHTFRGTPGTDGPRVQEKGEDTSARPKARRDDTKSSASRNRRAAQSVGSVTGLAASGISIPRNVGNRTDRPKFSALEFAIAGAAEMQE